MRCEGPYRPPDTTAARPARRPGVWPCAGRRRMANVNRAACCRCLAFPVPAVSATGLLSAGRTLERTDSFGCRSQARCCYPSLSGGRVRTARPPPWPGLRTEAALAVATDRDCTTSRDPDISVEPGRRRSWPAALPWILRCEGGDGRSCLAVNAKRVETAARFGVGQTRQRTATRSQRIHTTRGAAQQRHGRTRSPTHLGSSCSRPLPPALFVIRPPLCLIRRPSRYCWAFRFATRACRPNIWPNAQSIGETRGDRLCLWLFHRQSAAGALLTTKERAAPAAEETGAPQEPAAVETSPR